MENMACGHRTQVQTEYRGRAENAAQFKGMYNLVVVGPLEKIQLKKRGGLEGGGGVN